MPELAKVIEVRHVKTGKRSKPRKHYFFWCDYVYALAKRTRLRGVWEVSLDNGHRTRFRVHADERGRIAVTSTSY